MSPDPPDTAADARRVEVVEADRDRGSASLGPGPPPSTRAPSPIGEASDAGAPASGSGWRIDHLWPWLRRSWPYLRYLAGIVLLLLTAWVLSSHTDELSGLGSLFSHFDWWWILPAIAVEAGSFGAFAQVQYELLRAGGVHARRFPLFQLTLASQAIINSVPAGAAVAMVYGFRWYRRFGADDSLAAWTLVGTVVTATLTLSLVAAAGVAMATSYGASLDLIPVIFGVLLIAALAGAMFVYDRPVAVVVSWSLRAVRRLTGRPRGDLMGKISSIVARITSVRLGWRQVGVVVGWGLLNWILDATCFAFSFLAVGAGVPWKGLLLAYGAGQLAANLPITPGGLGAVEGSITIALVAFGGPATSTVEAVLVYRLVSFWGQLVVGWSCAGSLALGVRNGRWPRHLPARPLTDPGRSQPATAPVTVSVDIAGHPEGDG